ncbi:PBP family phospholipid-binding protein [Sinobacterium caligoides]|uniref:PBP family phospholipid-binding protein n=1 Tax=Sinobacterium caligoides TaxID=933926 RepID=A0A3N2DPB7_9GAMM|nr:YbhB/YbcL family Raf kinase inhibitor-like protein [Sinobacterium caligoides]ROS01647.1 PBP family phospholipid-binding protein [Sinobacterium caligoides]
MKKTLLVITLPISFSLLSPAFADTLVLTSTDVAHGKVMSKAQVFEGFGCSGGNVSPQLSWSGAPEGTEAFAIQVYDPDAPTGSGWWHWQLVNIPKHVNSLAAGVGDSSKNMLPMGSISITNDYGVAGFGGACPPEGHGTHRYQYTIHALSKKLELPEGASNALAGYMINSHSLVSSTIEATYER